jgi:hypothetical protein
VTFGPGILYSTVVNLGVRGVPRPFTTANNSKPHPTKKPQMPVTRNTKEKYE